MPSIADIATGKLVDSYVQGKPLTIKKAVLDAGGSLAYAEHGMLRTTKTFQNGIEAWRSRTAKILEKKTAMALKLIDGDKLAKHSAKDLMSIAATAIDKTQVLTGGATANVSLLVNDISEI